jgi:hypothetical protein
MGTVKANNIKTHFTLSTNKSKQFVYQSLFQQLHSAVLDAGLLMFADSIVRQLEAILS